MINSTWGETLVDVELNGTLGLRVAEEVSSNADATQWMFKIRKGVEYHNGATMTAEDVVATLKRHTDEKSQSGALGIVQGIADMKAEGDMEWQDWLVDESPNQETRLGESQELGQRKQMLAAALRQLTDREKHIIVERRLVDEPKTLEDLSAKYGISRERVRQIEVRAFEKLQKAMKNMVVEAATKPTTQPALARG